MGAIDRLLNTSVRCVSGGDGFVYEVRRVRSADLAKHATVELVGMMAVQKELEKARKEAAAAEKDWKRERTAEKDREAVKRKEAEREAHNASMEQAAIMRTIAENPALASGWLAKVDAYCCAGIVGIGIEGEGETVDPVTFTLRIEDESPEQSIVWIGRINEETRRKLSQAIDELSGSPTVATFR